MKIRLTGQSFIEGVLITILIMVVIIAFIANFWAGIVIVLLIGSFLAPNIIDRFAKKRLK